MPPNPSKIELINSGFALLCRFIAESPEPHHFETLESWLDGESEAIEMCGLPMLRQVVVALVQYASTIAEPAQPGSEAFENLQTAAIVLARLREHFLEASELYVAEVVVRRKLPDRDYALSVAEFAAARFPNDWACQCGLANTLRDLGRPDDALQAAERAFALDPREGAPLFDAGQAFLEAGRPTDAAAVFERVLGSFPAYPGAAEALRAARERAAALG